MKPRSNNTGRAKRVPSAPSGPAPASAAVRIPVIELATVTAMAQPERVNLFVLKHAIGSRIFVELGKLFAGIESGLAKGETIFGVLQAVGIRKGSVSNASQTARVLKELVTPGHLPEHVFDTFTWADICAINRVMSGASKRKLSAVEVARIIVEQSSTYDAEFETLFEHGQTVVEKAAADAKAEQDRLAEEQRAAEAARAAALELEQLRQQNAQLSAGTPGPAPASAPGGTGGSPVPEGGSPSTSIPPTAEPHSAQSAPIPDPDPASPTTASPSPVESNEVAFAPLPTTAAPANPDTALPEILAALDELAVTASALSLTAKKSVFAKLNECLGFLGEQITEAEREAA